MKFKFTLIIDGVKDKNEAVEEINQMLDAYDFYCRDVKENPEDEVYIDWPGDQGDELAPDLDA